MKNLKQELMKQNLWNFAKEKTDFEKRKWTFMVTDEKLTGEMTAKEQTNKKKIIAYLFNPCLSSWIFMQSSSPFMRTGYFALLFVILSFLS